MSTLQEKKFLQLIKFSYDLSLKVTRTFTKTNVLNTYNNSFVDFLNANKHEIYHLWNNNTRCCVCTSNVLLKHSRNLNKEQFTKLFDINGNATSGHFKKGQGQYIIQYCLCGISCIASCSLDDLDVILIHTLLRTFLKLNPDDEIWLDTVREIRNNLAHAVSTTCFDRGRLEKWWSMLEGSVLGLARKIPPDYYADSIEEQIKLLGKIDFNINDEEIRKLIKTENKKLYDLIIKEHDNKCQQIMDKQDMYAKDIRDKSETIKEEILKHLKQTKDDLSIEIKRLTFPVKLHGMETMVKSETTDATVNPKEAEQADIKCKEEPSQSPSATCQNEQYSERCQVEWRLKTPDTWRVEQIKQTLENVSGMLRQWFHIEFIYVGSLVLHTSVPRHILRDRQCLKSAIQSFLEKIVEVCDINTDVPETVNVDFRVFEMTSHTEKICDVETEMATVSRYTEETHRMQSIPTPNIWNWQDNKMIILPYKYEESEKDPNFGINVKLKRTYNSDMDLERKLYFRLYSFCIGNAMDILSFFIDTCILNNTDFDLFLNRHKHEMFHRWIPTIPCCECIASVPIVAPYKRRILHISQMKTVYKLDGAEVIGHVKTNHRKEISQYCLCKISALPGITTENLDIALIHCLIKTCASAIFSKVQNHLEVIRNIRNKLAHANRGIMTEKEFNHKWNDLENAVLAIAKEVSESFARRQKKLIDSLKKADTNLEDVTDEIEYMEET